MLSGPEARQAEGGQLPLQEQHPRADAAGGAEGHADPTRGQRPGRGPRGGGGRDRAGLELGQQRARPARPGRHQAQVGHRQSSLTCLVH